MCSNPLDAANTNWKPVCEQVNILYVAWQNKAYGVQCNIVAMSAKQNSFKIKRKQLQHKNDCSGCTLWSTHSLVKLITLYLSASIKKKLQLNGSVIP